MKQYIVVKDTEVTPFQRDKCGKHYNYYAPRLTIVDWHFTEADIINGQQFDTWYILLSQFNPTDEINGFTVSTNSIIRHE